MSSNVTPEKRVSNEDLSEKEVGLQGGAPVSHLLTAHQSQYNGNHVTAEETKRTKRIMRALDLRVLPIASILYLFSFLDRSAIGNARVAGMNEQLVLTYSQYAASVSVFFALYCLLEGESQGPACQTLA